MPRQRGEAMIDYVVITGDDPAEAKRKVFSMCGRKLTTVKEIYGRGSINETANQARRGLEIKVLVH